MAQFLSEQWIDDLAMAAAGTTIDPEVDLVVQQVVVGQGGSDDVTYALRLRDGKVEVAAGRAEDADITFTQDRETAADIASGRLPAQAAFMAGRLRVAGDLRTVLARARDLGSLDDILASARATTTW
ncbi:MAG TPA: SCP2 sterol-binding domain-containing protein [Acidimicrobiales bacterium]